MAQHKQRRGLCLSNLFEMQPIAMSLDKLIGHSDLSFQHRPIHFAFDIDPSLSVLAKDLGSPALDQSMDSFIGKYGLPSYSSLDELLAASVQTTQNPYMAPPKEGAGLFDGLDSLLNF